MPAPLHHLRLTHAPLGQLLVGFDGMSVVSCRLEKPSPAQPDQWPADPVGRWLVDTLLAYLHGEDLHALSQIRVQPQGGSPFQQQVWAAARQIPAGETRSYAQLAQAMGHPGASRALANALGANPCLLFIPCHRVIRSDGRLGGFSAGSGAATKAQLLALEQGVAIPPLP